MTRRLDEAIRLTEQSLQRAVQHQISFQWLHEAAFKHQNFGQKSNFCQKSKFWSKI